MVFAPWRLCAKFLFFSQLLAVGALIFFASGCSRLPSIRVVVPQSAPLLDLAAREVAARLQQAGYRVQISTGAGASAGLTNAVILNVAAEGSGAAPESFEITPIRTNGFLLLRVTGADARATLWGALEAADQIASATDLDAVRAARANSFLEIRASQLPLPASPLPGQRELWRQYFGLLARSRFNSVFFQSRGSVTRYTDLDSGGSAAQPADEERRANVEWFHDLFRMARDRGLNPYLVLDKSAVAEIGNREQGTGNSQPEAQAGNREQGTGNSQPDALAGNRGQGTGNRQPDALAGNRGQGTGNRQPQPLPYGRGSETPARSNLPRVLPSVLQTYPELAGTAFSADLVAMAGPPERRAGWMAENFLLPLAEKNERRPVFVAAGDWWPPKGAFGGIESTMSVRLWAPVQKLEELPAAAGYPVLWQVESGPEELRPWQDPNAVRETLLGIGAKKALGFVDSPQQEGREEPSPVAPSNLDQIWFRVMLWGRLGYSPEVPGQYWEDQFAHHFASGSGRFVYSAAIHGNQVLGLLHSYGASDAALYGKPATEASRLEQSLFQPVSGSARRDLIADALSQQGLLLGTADSGKSGPSSSALPEALEHEAHLSLAAADAAARHGAWTGANDELYQRLQSVANMGLAYADYLRGIQLLARFLVADGEDSRQQAIHLLQQAQQGLAAVEAKSSKMAADMGSGLVARTSSAIEFGKQLQPWRWEKTAWEVGVREAWQPLSATDVPVPPQWRQIQTSRLSEFGLYGRQPWMSSINQQVRSAFLPSAADAAPVPGSLLVGRSVVAAKEEGRLLLRVVADESAAVWVNRRRAFRLSPRQVPWMASSAPAAPLQAQLLSAPIQAGNNELLIAASAKEKWPLLSVSFLVAPEKKDMVTISAPRPARLEGGVMLSPASEISPQPYIGLAEDALAPAEPAPPRATSSALYSFRIRDAGFYRFRAWCFWRAAASPGITLRLDGFVFKKSVGRGDATYQKWHWVPIEGVAGLGSGEHTLAITDWNRGAWLGAIEVDPAW